MRMFISCDWGTSSFRLRLVNVADRAVLAEVKSSHGIGEAYQKWSKQEGADRDRFSFFQSIIKGQLEKLQQRVTYSVHDMPLIISGMASSNIGMIELPYKALPFALDGSDLVFQRIAATEYFPNEMIIISGARTATDVMRGEEIQIIGCDFNSGNEHIYILPGTHSKHVTVKDQYVVDFKTYMTGEFFNLLSHHGILSTSVQSDTALNNDASAGFEAGVMQSRQSNILHNAFLVRTNHLFGYYSREVNYHYLSGLLIGTELRECAGGKIPVTVVGNELMRKYYATALQKLGKTDFELHDVDLALVRGHAKMYELLSTH